MSDAHTITTPSGLSVERLLAEDLLHNTLLGGATGLDRSVRWCVPLMEDPSGASCSGDLAGMAVFLPAQRLSGQEGGRLVQNLSECGAVVLLAWSGQPVVDLQDATDAADAAGLPLVQLPARATFPETSRLIATKLLAQSTHVLEYGTRVHRALGDVFSQGGGLNALAYAMAQLSGTTVLVLGTTGELIASSPTEVGGERSPAFVRRVAELLAQPDRGPGFLPEDPAHPNNAHVVTLELDEQHVHVIVCPVRVAGEPYGVLALVELEHSLEEHDLAQHIVVAEQSVSLAASELLRQQSVREAEERARNDFVHALLHGRFTDQLELSARAEHYRFPLDGQFAVFIVTSTGLRPDESSSRRKAREAGRAAQSVASEDGWLTLTALVGSMLVVVRQVACDQSGEVDPRALSSFGEALRRSMKHRLRDTIKIAYGRPATGASGAARSYREARTAEALGRRVTTGPVTAYSDLRVFAAVQDAALSTGGQAFARETLAPLRHLDGQTGNLEEVVYAYIAESGNLNATARRLHLHRNTMLYKLERASRALNMDVRTTEVQFMIWLAHHIDALSDVVSALDQELAPPT